MLEVRTAGDPDEPETLFTDLSPRTMAETVTQMGTPVSAMAVREWLESLGLGCRKIEKSLAGGVSPDRDAQFCRIKELIEEYRLAMNPVFSIDTKAKEHLGQLFRAGRVRTESPFLAFDHDFPRSAEEQGGQKESPGWKLRGDKRWQQGAERNSSGDLP